MDLKRFILFIKINLKVTFLLMGINILMYLVTLLVSIPLNFDSSASLFLLGAEYTPSILQGEIWRLVMSSFLHANFFHLFVNMWALFTFGTYLEAFYGSRKLFLTYIISAISGSLLSILANVLITYSSQGQSTAGISLSVGASGAIFGLVGVLIGNKLRNNTYSPALPINTTQLWIFVGYNLLIGFGIDIFGGSQLLINNWAHLGGLIAGIILGIFIDTKFIFYKKTLKLFLEKALFIVSIIIFLLSFAAEIVYFVSKLLAVKTLI